MHHYVVWLLPMPRVQMQSGKVEEDLVKEDLVKGH